MPNGENGKGFIAFPGRMRRKEEMIRERQGFGIIKRRK